MKYFILLALVLPFCVAIEVKFQQTYGTAIKKVEIASCVAEPCPFVKGKPLNISVTVESVYPGFDYQTVTDFETTISIGAYRNRYVYQLVYSSPFCKNQPKECPLSMHKLYTIKNQLFLSPDKKTDEWMSGFGSYNGKRNANINVVMITHDNEGTVVGDANIVLDIKAAQN